MTQERSIFDIPVAHGRKARGNKKTTSECLDKSLMCRKGYRVVRDTSDKDGMYFCAADFGGDDRGNANVKSIGIIAMDIDDSSREDVVESVARIREDGLEFILYTTASHNPEVVDKETGRPRIGYRIILRAPRDLNISEYKYAIDYIDRHYKLNAAPESRVAVQAMYYPTVLESNKEHVKFIYDEGNAVSIPDEVMDSAAEEYAILTSGTSTPILPPQGIEANYYLSTLLDLINPSDLDYHEWLEASFAIHHQTLGKGEELWNTWSAQDERYNPSEMQAKWQSFSDNPQRKGVTLRTLLNKEVAKGVTNETRLIAKLIKQSENGKVLENLRVHVVEQTKDGFLRGVNTTIAKAYVTAKKRLFDIDITQAMAQHELRHMDISEEKRRYFYDNYVYVSPTNEYFDLSTGHLRNKTFMHDHYTAEYGTTDAKGEAKNITHVLATTNVYDRPRFVNGFVYEPQEPGQIVTKVDGLYVNEFQHNKWHIISPNNKFNPDRNPIDRKINGIVNTHFEILSDGRPEVKKFLMQYLGHLRQKPGVRIHHALCITSSAQGIGKSINYALYEAVLGEPNIKHLDKRTMMQANFNSYVSAKVMVQVIDEFDDLSDRKSAEILTSLKTAITADKGPVAYKGKNDDGNVPYHSQYILFSNNRNVLNGEGGRRWSQFDIRNVIMRPADRKADESLEAIIGYDREVFWSDYQMILREYPERLAAMFDSINLDGFNVNSPLIMEREAESSGSLSIEGVVAATHKEMLEANHPFVRDDIVKITAFQDRCARNFIEMSGGDQIQSHRSLRKVVVQFLMDKGYRCLNTRKVIRGMGTMSQMRIGSIYIKGKTSKIVEKYNEVYVKPPIEDEDEDI